MKKVIILLLCLSSVINSFGLTRDAICSRVEQQLEEARGDFYRSDLVSKLYNKASAETMATLNGEKYVQARERCEKENRNHRICPVFAQAYNDLVATEEYQKYFLPLDKAVVYASYKVRGLEKMQRYVRCRTWENPIESMKSGLNSALYIDTSPENPHRSEMRDQVALELRGLIASEEQKFAINKMERAIDKMERLMNN